MASNPELVNSVPDEHNWVVQIKQMLDEVPFLDESPVCVYYVPKSLRSAKPEAFTPQLVGLGPYHHFRPELYPMERFKLTSTTFFLAAYDKQLEDLVKKLKEFGSQIRPCYHKYIDHSSEDTLFYILAIDSFFLFDLLYWYCNKEDSLNPFFMPNRNQQSGVKLTVDAIITDVLMLENQIPTSALRKIWAILTSNSDFEVEDDFNLEVGEALMSFCEARSPLPFDQHHTTDFAEAAKHAHILDLMYHLIVPPPPPPQPNSTHTAHKDAKPHAHRCFDLGENFRSRRGKIIDAIKRCYNKLGDAFGEVRRSLEGLSKTDITVLQPFALLLGGVLRLCPNPNTNPNPSGKRAPVAVMIPSVTELHDAGVQFSPIIKIANEFDEEANTTHDVGIHSEPTTTKGGIGDIKFDEETNTLFLPEIKLNVHTEVIMRNLVAYETLIKSEHLIFTKYTELMRAIIDTAEDVKLLENEGIIVNELGKKELAEQLFNGMSKSIAPTKTPKLQETIVKVNNYYNKAGKVRAYRLMTKYVYSSWKLFTLLATLMLLALMAIQTVCSVYDCPRMLKTSGTKTA